MKYSILFLALLTLSIAAAGTALAAGQPMPGHKMDMPAMEERQLSGFHLEYMEAMKQMHGSMTEAMMAADPDIAFAEGMIPHHRGAVEMARIQLKYGKDPELRKLAESIIDSQEKEIQFMEEWLKTHTPQK